MVEILTPEHFLPHVKKIFRVRGGRHALTLINVDIGDSTGAPRQPFNLIFTGPPGDVLAQGLYTLEVDGAGAFELYVIPIRTLVPGRQDYQAAFN